MSPRARIVTLPGDGIGPEIMAAAASCSTRLGEFELDEQLVGGASIDAHGTALTDEVLDACRDSDAVLLAAVGGPKWDTTDPSAPRPEQGLLGLRKGLGLFANLRPVRPEPGAARREPAQARAHRGHRPARGARAHRRHLLRRPRPRRRHAPTTPASTSVAEIERIARGGASSCARTEGHERGQGQRARDLAAVARDRRARAPRSTRTIPLEHLLVDNAAMQLVSRPAEFDVILTENMFGDILSDEAAMLTGSIGMLPSASLGDGRPGPVRARARLGARHRRHRQGQPAGDVRLGGDDAAPRTGYGERGRRRRIGRRPRARGGPPDAGPRRRRHHRGRHQGGPREPLTEGVQYVNTADLIWLNGEFVAWEDAKVHVLTHAPALRHGRLRGHPRATRPSAARRSSATHDHLDRLEALGQALLHGPARTRRSSCARPRTS